MKQQYQYMQGSKNSRPGGWIQGVSADIFYISLIFHGSRGGPSILPVVRMPWCPTFYRGGGVSRCLIIPYLSPYNLCFSKGSGLPSGSKHAILGLSGCCDKS